MNVSHAKRTDRAIQRALYEKQKLRSEQVTVDIWEFHEGLDIVGRELDRSGIMYQRAGRGGFLLYYGDQTDLAHKLGSEALGRAGLADKLDVYKSPSPLPNSHGLILVGETAPAKRY